MKKSLAEPNLRTENHHWKHTYAWVVRTDTDRMWGEIFLKI